MMIVIRFFFIIFLKNMETFKIQLSNGSLANLADGVKMDVNSSIIELADNAYDAEATEII